MYWIAPILAGIVAATFYDLIMISRPSVTPKLGGTRTEGETAPGIVSSDASAPPSAVSAK